MVFVVTAIAVMILSYDLNDPEDSDTEETPLTAPRPRARKQLFTILMCLFLVTTLILAILGAFLDQSAPVIAAEVILSILMVTSLILIHCKIPLNQEETDGTLSFKSPGKPYVQGFSVLINLVLLLHLEANALKQLVIYVIVGLIIYFGYGIFFSKITAEKQGISTKNVSLEESETETSVT